MFGYNTAYNLILQVLKHEPKIRAAMVAELSQIPESEKVLRFPGGTVSRTWKYNEEDMDLWIKFCSDAGVTSQSFVWNISDHDSSLAGYNHLKQHQTIVAIEVGNEENYHQRATGFWKGLINSFAPLTEWYYRPRGQVYGYQVNHVKNLLHGSPHPPIAAVFGSPDALPSKFWNMGVIDKVPDLKDIVIHNYRKFPDNNFMVRFPEAMIQYLSDYQWWFTEMNMDYENGRYYDRRFDEEHRVKLVEYAKWATRQQQTQLVQIHSLYKNNGFGRYVWLNDQLKDNYPGWFNF